MRSRSGLLALCLTGALALCGWLFAAVMQAPMPPQPPAPPPPPAAPAAELDPAPPDRLAMAERAEAPRLAVPLAAPSPTPADLDDDAVVLGPEDRGPTVRVVRGNPPAAVPNAIVFFVTADVGRSRMERHGQPAPEYELSLIHI